MGGTWNEVNPTKHISLEIQNENFLIFILYFSYLFVPLQAEMSN